MCGEADDVTKPAEVTVKTCPESPLYKFYCGVCSFLPQDCSGDPSLFPRTSQICNWCSFTCIVLALWVHNFYEYVDPRPAATFHDLSSVRYHTFTASVAFAGLVYEVSLAFAISFMGLSARYQSELVLRRRLRLNRKMIFVFFIVTLCYSTTAYKLGVVHRSWIADYYGGNQIVFSVRYSEWILGSSMVMAIQGQMDHTSEGVPRNGIVPSSVLTGIYCIIAWQALVVKDVYVAWFLIAFTFTCYFCASAQQLMFAWSIKNVGRSGPLRASLLVYVVAMIGLYGAFYLLAILGWISPHFEDKFYCVGDAVIKLLTSCMLCATNDVVANDELRRSALAKAADLARIIQTASVPIFGVDTNCNITEWNLKTVELTGIPKEEAMGSPLIRLIGVESRQDFQTTLRKALDGDEQVGSLETRFFLQADEVDGPRNIGAKKPTLLLSAAATKDSLGKVKGVTFVGCDVTEVSAFKEAEARKIRFMAVVSHELRSPLHGIIGLMDYFTQGEQDQRKLRYIKMVHNCATRLLDLVVNIMEIASMMSKNPKDLALKLSRDPVELNKIMDEILVLVQNSYDKSGTRPLLKKTVQIFNNMEPLPIIEADAHKCTQIFYNIITNACKFTMEGSITISSRLDPGGEWVDVLVSDTGRGIEAASLERIFQPFEQTDSPAVRGHQGIGLGLSIALEVVKRHGGRIQVQSEVGVGTTFIVRLPTVMSESLFTQPEGCCVAEENITSPPTIDIPAEGFSQTTESYNKKPLLLSVDDEAVNQDVVQNILQDHYEIRVAMSGEEAIAYLRSATELPKLMLLDVAMPGISGFDVCKFVRQELGVSETTLPILMLSASSVGTTIAEALNCGANSYVFKPFERQSLKAQVQSALRLQSLYNKRRIEKSSTPFTSNCSISTESSASSM